MKNQVIVFFSNTRFDSTIQAAALFIARNLARHNKVYFVDYPFTLKDYYTAENKEAVKARKGKFTPSADCIIDTAEPNFKIVIAPLVLPINFLPEGALYRITLKANEVLIANRLKKMLQKEGIKEFVYINSFNFHFPGIAKHIKPTLTIYHCVDPMIVPYDMKHGITSEKMLVKESDLVICTSRALYNQKKQQNPNAWFVPNGSDVEYFNASLQPELLVHEKISALPKPVIGYLGTIERRIDYALVNQLVKDNPEKNFVFTGPVWGNHAEALKPMPNLHVIGKIPYVDAPSLVKGFDVAIIPFKKDEVSNTIFPLKLFEFLSAGKPVVLTDFNTDLKEYTGNCVWYCADKTAFSNAINEALATETPEKVAERLAIARENTWEKRADAIGEIIMKYLK